MANEGLDRFPPDDRDLCPHPTILHRGEPTLFLNWAYTNVTDWPSSVGGIFSCARDPEIYPDKDQDNRPTARDGPLGPH
jgi:hypothetical protein